MILMLTVFVPHTSVSLCCFCLVTTSVYFINHSTEKRLNCWRVESYRWVKSNDLTHWPRSRIPKGIYRKCLVPSHVSGSPTTRAIFPFSCSHLWRSVSPKSKDQVLRDAGGKTCFKGSQVSRTYLRLFLWSLSTWFFFSVQIRSHSYKWKNGWFFLNFQVPLSSRFYDQTELWPDGGTTGLSEPVVIDG